MASKPHAYFRYIDGGDQMDTLGYCDPDTQEMRQIALLNPVSPAILKYICDCLNLCDEGGHTVKAMLDQADEEASKETGFSILPFL